MNSPVQLNSDQFESSGLDSPTFNKSYLQKTPPVGFPSTQEMYSKRFSSSSFASSVSDFALPYSPTTETSQRESMAAQRQIKDLEKKLNDTLTELDRVKKENRESIELNKTHVRRIKQLEQDTEQLKIVNKSLSNDIEDYQAKLVNIDDQYKQLEIKYYEEKKNNENHSKSNSSEDGAILGGEVVHKESDHTLIERLQDEIKTLKGDNESMTLYIQKMLGRIMEVKGFEETLATNWTSSSQEKSSKPVAPAEPEKPTRPNSLKTDFKFPRSPPSAKTSFTTLREDETEKYDDNEPEEHQPRRSPLSLTTFESLENGNASLPKKERTSSNSADGALVQESPRYVNVPKRSATTNVIPTGAANTATNSASSKRISGLFKWSVAAVATATMRNAAAAKKEDPYMKPILLVQAKDRVKD